MVSHLLRNIQFINRYQLQETKYCMLQRKIVGNSQEIIQKSKPNVSQTGSKSKNKIEYQGIHSENRVITIQFVKPAGSREKSEQNHQNKTSYKAKGIKVKLSPQIRFKTKVSSLQPSKRQFSDQTKTNSNKMSKSPSIQRKTQVKWRQRIVKSKPTLHPQNSNKMLWEEHRVPYTVQQTLSQFSQHLSKHQKQQIHSFKRIYYIGHKLPVDIKQQARARNWSNQQKEYLCLTNDHIGYQYELLEQVGKGAYGQVLKAFDHKNKTFVALKIIRNKSKYSKQALNEYKILSYLKKDAVKTNNIVIVQDFFTFRKFTFIVFQLLSINLFQLIKKNKFSGLPEQFVRRISIQLFTILDTLKNRKIIHSDIKPQNIILKDPDRSGIKIIDFGSSCFINQTVFTYIQSRFYRAPQIFLGCNYDHRIDIWSVGCVLAELYLGVPLFPGQSEFQQMRFYITAFGYPSKNMIMSGFRNAIFFKNQKQMSAQMAAIIPLAQFNKPLPQRIKDEDFRTLIQNLLKWDPKQRWTPCLALQSEWIQKGLPSEFRNFDLINRKNYSNSELIHTKKSQQKKI